MADITKQALLRAFGQLLEEKSFNKITIIDLTARCGLNRMTFYYHFDNIYELMIKRTGRLLDGLIERMLSEQE